ncbi:mediator of RNA polymerase II transcription subunit 14 [Tetranychus urticae]|uniref:Mediator of RNA polymerase II transcription subunit 14 n=1 Tax=Tetranychus urticae TaxID=32264 RepID=T1JUF0_TETUR|nr:mediator of RNA polymerase II transcription subunit 14 [Tetranychus urticae]
MALVETNSFQNRPMSMPTMSLSRLVDFTVQRTYHELLILTDLLPQKSDIERKIEIISFANRTRQLFIRLLALVKWAGSASKVEKCSTIVAFLNKQAMFFIETADSLAKMARENLVQARLPALQLPAAVEVLTLGSYTRLPTCIRDRIVPPDSITPAEKKATLQRLNQIIQQRLVISNLSPQMKNFKIDHGRVIFHVNHEFEMALTLMGDNPNLPWRVLSIDFLVEDKETGGGKDLVHPIQVRCILDIIQSRLNDNSKSLLDPYIVLHTFCLSLQLEVLHAQATRLSRERLGELVKVEEYFLGKKLCISYWRNQDDKSEKSDKSESKSPCKIIIEIDNQDQSKLLQVTHLPELDADTTLSNEPFKFDHLSLEKLLIHTTHERARQYLSSIQEQIKNNQIGKCSLSGCPPVLQISFVHDSLPHERIAVAVDTFSGQLLADIPMFDDPELKDELQTTIKKDPSNWSPLLDKLKILVYRDRFKRAAEYLSVSTHDSLLWHSSVNHPVISDTTTAKLYVQFCRYPKNFMLITFKPNLRNSEKEMDFRYYLLSIEPVPIEFFDDQSSSDDQDIPKLSAKLLSLFEIDVPSSLGSPKAAFEYFNLVNGAGKRKLICDDYNLKRSKICNSFTSEFMHLVNFCDEKLFFGVLSSELLKRRICHQVRDCDKAGYMHYIDITQYPPDSFESASRLRSNLISCTIRLQSRGIYKIWVVSLTFFNSPVLNQTPRDATQKKVVCMVYDFSTGFHSQLVQMINDLHNDWIAISKVYEIFADFIDQMNATNSPPVFEIKSFNYKKLTLGYGPNKGYIVSINWKPFEKRYHLSFAINGLSSSNINPHLIIAAQLQHEFNQHRSIAWLLQTLNSTFSPLLTLQNLTSTPLLGVVNSRPHVPVQTFCIVPQKSNHIRLIYRNTYCLDIILSVDGFVSIRDGAYSLFDKAKVLEELSPIQGLKAFLNKFVDKNAAQMRRLSQTEDDNPPSPMTHIEHVEPYLFQSNHNQTASPMTINSAQDSMMMNAGGPGARGMRQVMTPGSLSHPNTPASPHTSVLNQNAYASSPNPSFALASPPSHGYQTSQSGQIAPSPSIPVSHPEQSPGNIFGVNSPMNPLHAPSPSFLPIASPSAATNIHSPASNFMSTSHDHSVNSPFPGPGGSNISMQSPASVPWPNSPSMARPSPRPGPSPVGGGLGASPQTNVSPHYHNVPGHIAMSSTRFLPQRAWAAANPTLLTYQGFDNMCRPHAPLESPPAHHHNPVYASLSQLERFLGCVFMRKTLQRTLGAGDGFQVITSNPTPGIIQFKNETLQFKITVHPITMQSLQISIIPFPEHENSWLSEELDILKRFFESRVVCAPYKPNPFISYSRLLNVPHRVCKDCIQLMRLELFPDPSLKWTLQWLLTITPAQLDRPIGKPGMSAVFVFKGSTVVFFLQFTRVMHNLPMNVEPQTLVIPFMFEMERNILRVASDKSTGAQTQTYPVINEINTILARYNEYQMQSGEYSIFHAIREIMMSDLAAQPV